MCVVEVDLILDVYVVYGDDVGVFWFGCCCCFGELVDDNYYW